MSLICVMFLVLLGTLPSCATAHRTTTQDPKSVDGLADLTQTRITYENALRAASTDQQGWIAVSCDGLLFSSLFGAALVDPAFVKIDAGEDLAHPGKWLRRPAALGTCTPTISKDMLLGLTFYAWRAKRPDIMKAVTDYGVAHEWVMGDVVDPGDLGKVVVTPALAALMYQVLYKLGGDDHPTRHVPDDYPAGMTGFEAHLQVLNILLHGEVDDTPGITDVMLTRLQEHAAANPKNALYASALGLYTGDVSQAITLWGDQEQWPAGAIPTSLNHCQAWPSQRDDDDTAWQPCAAAESGIFYGADFVFGVDLLARPKRAG